MRPNSRRARSSGRFAPSVRARRDRLATTPPRSLTPRKSGTFSKPKSGTFSTPIDRYNSLIYLVLLHSAKVSGSLSLSLSSQARIPKSGHSACTLRLSGRLFLWNRPVVGRGAE